MLLCKLNMAIFLQHGKWELNVKGIFMFYTIFRNAYICDIFNFGMVERCILYV